MMREKAGKSRTGSKMSIILFFALILVIVGLAFFVYAQSQGIDIRNVNLADAVKKKLQSGKL